MVLYFSGTGNSRYVAKRIAGALDDQLLSVNDHIKNAAKYNHALCWEKQLTYMGTMQIVMPENYIAMFNAPQAEEARQIVAKAEPDIDRTVSAILADQVFPSPRHNLYDHFMSGP